MGKQRLTIWLALAICLSCSATWSGPAATELNIFAGNSALVVDPLTGVALGGYDPVSYFTENQPVPGRPEFDFYWGNVPWYFSSAANRDAFSRAPEVYAPVFGGYGVMSLSRGFLSAGNPRIFAVLAGRLFLFHSQGNREAFLASPREAYKAADRQWTILSPSLATGSR